MKFSCFLLTGEALALRVLHHIFPVPGPDNHSLGQLSASRQDFGCFSSPSANLIFHQSSSSNILLISSQ
jgi:hypothetical protein